MKTFTMMSVLLFMMSCMQIHASLSVNTDESTPADESGHIGILIVPDGVGLRIAMVFAHRPAQAAGILEGDYIWQVDGQDVSGMDLKDVIGAIYGEPGTAVTLLLERNHVFFDVTVVREAIN